MSQLQYQWFSVMQFSSDFMSGKMMGQKSNLITYILRMASPWCLLPFMTLGRILKVNYQLPSFLGVTVINTILIHDLFIFNFLTASKIDLEQLWISWQWPVCSPFLILNVSLITIDRFYINCVLSFWIWNTALVSAAVLLTLVCKLRPLDNLNTTNEICSLS